MLTKKTFREISKTRLKKRYKNGYARHVNVRKKIEFLLKKLEVKTVLSYISTQFEVDTYPLNLRLRKSHKLLVPFMQGVSLKAVTYRLPLHKKKFGILEPPNSHFNYDTIDLAIVPVLGVDGNYQRIGFGKGFYDRFYSQLKRKPVTVFVQIDTCYTREFLCDSHDIDADFYITPHEFLEIRNGNVVRDWSRDCPRCH